MNMNMKTWTLAASLLAIPATTLAAPPSATMLALACTGCHGSLGVSLGSSIPMLAGQSEKCIVDALQGFRSGARSATIMGRLARAYSDAEIAALAEYFSRQQAPVLAQARHGCAGI